MTDPIEEGVKLVPELERALGPLSGPQYPVTLDIGQCRTIIAALTAAGEMAREKQGCKMAWKQGFCYGDPAIGRT